MQVIYDFLPQQERNTLCSEHPRGQEIATAIELDLSRDPLSRATKLSSGRFAQIFAPAVSPPLEVKVSYLVGQSVLITVFKWDLTV